MTVIDCADDEEIASNLVKYLISLGHDARQDNSLVIINERNVKNILKSFIKQAGKSGYDILQADSETMVLAKLTSIRNFGLSTCEICGYVAADEELFAHRRAHGIQLF
ncbi:MAG TPA: hypothetical protein VLA53_05875 [Nitrosopumilaceae archaeon]|nr:hypothetical protein [Nitrosopumilaceae archaeon]